jgi:ribosome biogenesis GTPase
LSADRLAALGFDAARRRSFEELEAGSGLEPGRVVACHGSLQRVATDAAELLCDVAGRLRHAAESALDLPAVGDFVAVASRPAEERGTIHDVLPRTSRFVRGAAGEQTRAQVVAANVDSVFLVCGLDRDYNPRRVERYLSLAFESGAQPVVLLNKADLHAQPEACRREIEGLAPGTPVHVLSAKPGLGLETLDPYLHPRRTVALLGSSGVGKSTLVNRLLGREHFPTREVRATDQRGRHTTSHRELVELPGGALLIDTPGMREIQLWDAEAGLSNAFADVSELATGCRFRDCRHGDEPGCAVTEAARRGALGVERLDGYRKLQAELRALERRQDALVRRAERRRWASIHKAARKHKPRS